MNLMGDKCFRRLIILFDKKDEEQIVNVQGLNLQQIHKELSEDGIEVVWEFVKAEDCANQIQERITNPDIVDNWYLSDGKRNLYLTDSPWIQEVLRLWGFYVAALVHEGNADVRFPNAKYLFEGLNSLDPVYLKQAYERLAGLPWDILETEHLAVRESTVEDVDEFYRIYKEPSITRYMDDLFREPDMERAYMRNYIQRIYGFYGYGLWTVLLKETGQVIGRAGISMRDGYDLPELGFVIEVAEQRKGYAFEVCSAILQYAKEELQMEGVQALVCAGNEASERLLTKLDFVQKQEVNEEGETYRQWVKMF